MIADSTDPFTDMLLEQAVQQAGRRFLLRQSQVPCSGAATSEALHLGPAADRVQPCPKAVRAECSRYQCVPSSPILIQLSI